MSRLVIGRTVGQSIRIGEDVTVTVVRVDGGYVRLSIDAPPEVSVTRAPAGPRDVRPPVPGQSGGAA